MRFLGSGMDLVLQGESSECGLACLAMISNYHGVRCDMRTLRRQFDVSPRGMTLRGIIDAAMELGFSARPLRIDINDLDKLTVPAILHWQFDHYVVLEAAKFSKTFRVHDPSHGTRTYTKSEVSERFTGVALELFPTSNLSQGGTVEKLSLRDFWRSTSGLVRSFSMVLLLSFMLQILSLGLPLFMQAIIDDVLVKGNTETLAILALGFAMLVGCRSFTLAVRGYVNIYLVHQLAFSIGSTVLHHLVRLPVEYFAKRAVGDVLSRFGSLQPIYDFLTNRTIAIVIDGLLSTLTLLFMLAYSLLLTSIVVIAVAGYVLVRIWRIRLLRSATQERLISEGRLETSLIETITNIREVRLANRETVAQTVSGSHLHDTINARVVFERQVVWYDVALALLVGLEQVVVLSAGAYLIVEDGLMSIGMLYAFLAYRQAFSNAALALVDNVLEYALVSVHIERVADILQVERDVGVAGSEGGLRLPIRGDIELRDVTFRYGKSEPAVLSGCSVVVSEGSFVAVVGPSGAGKSTLLLVLMGLLEPQSGTVTVGGYRKDAVGASNFREGMAAVSDRDGLISGTVADNIIFYAETVDMEMVERAARIAEVHEEIAALPMGYRAVVGNGGLSSGQQQRILIARAIYRSPWALFLDEGTAHVDGELERKIFDNLRELGITCVFATHNMELLSFADDVVIWENGRPAKVRPEHVAARGSMEERRI